MSLRTVADAAQIDPATLSRIENGKTQLTDDLAQKIAKVLHVSAGIFFSDPGLLETAMLRMRKAPLLTEEQLLVWRGPDEFEEAPEQEYLHVSIDHASRYVFALSAGDDANAPEIRPGDILLFDANRPPQFGDFVVAQRRSGKAIIGRCRPDQNAGTAGLFDVVPESRLYAEVGSKQQSLTLRGVLFEQRRRF